MINTQKKYPVRKRNRLLEWDYSTPHWYFVTICTQNHKELFGKIVEGKMVLNEYGEIVKFTWDDLPKHNPHVGLDEFVIMLNHVHGIIILNDMQNNVGTDSKSIRKRQSIVVGTDSKSVRTNQSSINRTGLDPVPTEKYHGIPEIVRQFKGFSARRINAIRNTQGQTIWQRSYYDHIIRNEKSLDNIRLYILENPMSWETDKITRKI
ncbi:transposase [bacterium]|nr:transposase [bacterium]